MFFSGQNPFCILYIRPLKFDKMEYNFREVEKNWQDYWAKNKTYKT
jgi:valyl-tRNA synthetase